MITLVELAGVKKATICELQDSRSSARMSGVKKIKAAPVAEN